MEALLKCKRQGCRQSFQPLENNAQACKFHSGKPIFHDLKKGWTCCNVIVYDWDEFQNIKPCAIGFHNEVDEAGASDQSQFYKSNTVDNAQKGLENFKENDKPAPKHINDYNKEQEEKKKLQEVAQQEKAKVLFKTVNGLNKCTNKGCLKEYNPDDIEAQKDDACSHHPGQPIFHDLSKSWTCCKVQKYDFDEFLLIKPCAKGQHVPKLV